MLTRRTATVTTSAPDASMTFCVSTKSLYLPVPTHRRDRNSIPAIVNVSSFMSGLLPSPDETDDLEAVAVAEARRFKRAAVHDGQVQFHCHAIALNLSISQ